jgi:hypothetical protein
MIVARVGDVEGACDKTNGCAQGDYYFKKIVAGGFSDPDPVTTLGALEAKWRKKQLKRPDQLFSEVLVDRQSLVADGKSQAWVDIALRNIQGDLLTSGGALISVISELTGAPTADVGAVIDNGDGTYSLQLMATTQPGPGVWHVIVDDGGAGPPRQLANKVQLNTDPLDDLHVGIVFQSMGSPLPVPFTINRGPAESGRPFLLLGSLSGTVPGLNLPSVHLPLNRDRFFQLTWTAAGGPRLPGSVGVLDADGRATPWLMLPPGSWAVLLGRQFDFCTLLGTPFQEVTTGVRFTVVP